MHHSSLDLSVTELSKVEGAASLSLHIENDRVVSCHLAIEEMQRFFIQATAGKPFISVPHQVARICGTCSNAHLLASIKAIEAALGVTPSAQTILLRNLLDNALMIRDHGLHLYVFVLPDLFGKDSILDFDEHNPTEHELLDDCFAVKEAGNRLGVVIGGRSVHAPMPFVGGFRMIPKKVDLLALLPVFADARTRILRLIDVFSKYKEQINIDTLFVGLFQSASWLEGTIRSSDDIVYSPSAYRRALRPVDVPYSQAPSHTLNGKPVTAGALARINLNAPALHPKTRADAKAALTRFPSNNIFDNNLAQAIEMLHAIDASVDLIAQYQELHEPLVEVVPRKGSGCAVIEAPRGLLYHEYSIDEKGLIISSDIIVPTAINHHSMEQAVAQYVNEHMDHPKELLEREIESVVRAFDPCMSCATHFLKIKWK